MSWLSVLARAGVGALVGAAVAMGLVPAELCGQLDAAGPVLGGALAAGLTRFE